MAKKTLGTYPTKVQRIDSLSNDATEFWIKRDDQTHPVYGGNKVRKLEYLLEDAAFRQKKKLVTIGAAGSHHVLATSVFGKRAGFDVEALLVPQRSTQHVIESLRADLAQGLIAHPARTYLGAALGLFFRSWGSRYGIPVGGSSLLGSRGYIDAAFELEEQVRRGEMPEPDVIVVAVGSGGTAAGLAAGLAATKLKTRVVGVVVAAPIFAVKFLTRFLAWRCFASLRTPRTGGGKLSFLTNYLGSGYGEATQAGTRAMEKTSGLGIDLDQTYTAKTFAAAFDLVQERRHHVVLYWHTLSSAPMGPLFGRNGDEQPFPNSLRKLLK